MKRKSWPAKSRRHTVLDSILSPHSRVKVPFPYWVPMMAESFARDLGRIVKGILSK